MLTQNFNYSTTLGPRILIPLKIAAGMFEDGIHFVAHKLIWGKDSQCLRVCNKIPIQKASDGLHGALLSAFPDGEIFPFDFHQRAITSVGFRLLTKRLVAGWY
jgi:hypothetical protein